MQKIEIKTADEARSYAIEWQQWASEQDLSILELTEWQDYFTLLAEQFPELKEEFIENAII